MIYLAKKKIVSFKDNEEDILEFADKQMLGNFSLYIKTLIVEDMKKKNGIEEKTRKNDVNNKKIDTKKCNSKSPELDF